MTNRARPRPGLTSRCGTNVARLRRRARAGHRCPRARVEPPGLDVAVGVTRNETKLPPVAFTKRRRVESNRSVRRSRREISLCPCPSPQRPSPGRESAACGLSPGSLGGARFPRWHVRRRPCPPGGEDPIPQRSCGCGGLLVVAPRRRPGRRSGGHRPGDPGERRSSSYLTSSVRTGLGSVISSHDPPSQLCGEDRESPPGATPGARCKQSLLPDRRSTAHPRRLRPKPWRQLREESHPVAGALAGFGGDAGPLPLQMATGSAPALAARLPTGTPATQRNT